MLSKEDIDNMSMIELQGWLANNSHCIQLSKDAIKGSEGTWLEWAKQCLLESQEERELILNRIRKIKLSKLLRNL